MSGKSRGAWNGPFKASYRDPTRSREGLGRLPGKGPGEGFGVGKNTNFRPGNPYFKICLGVPLGPSE